MEELEFLRKFENFTSRNLANLIGGSINRREMREPKQAFPQYECLSAYHQTTHTREKLTFVYIAPNQIFWVLLSAK